MMFSNYLTLNYEKIKICKKGLVYRISKTMFSSTSIFSASHIQPVIWNIAFFQFCTADMGPGENPLHYTQETILSVHFEGDHVGHIPHKKHLFVILITCIRGGLPLFSFVDFLFSLLDIFPLFV